MFTIINKTSDIYDSYFCEICGDELGYEETYEDEEHDVLCEYCLLKVHKKARLY